MGAYPGHYGIYNSKSSCWSSACPVVMIKVQLGFKFGPGSSSCCDWGWRASNILVQSTLDVWVFTRTLTDASIWTFTISARWCLEGATEMSKKSKFPARLQPGSSPLPWDQCPLGVFINREDMMAKAVLLCHFHWHLWAIILISYITKYFCVMFWYYYAEWNQKHALG